MNDQEYHDWHSQNSEFLVKFYLWNTYQGATILSPHINYTWYPAMQITIMIHYYKADRVCKI